MDSTSPTSGELRDELRGDAQTLTDTAKTKLADEVDARKGTAVTQAHSLSSALEAAAGELSDSPDWLRTAFQKAAQSLQRFADTIENKDSRQLTRDVQQLARDNPLMFLAGSAAAGFAAARVLKAGVETGPATSTGFEQSGALQPYEPYQGESTGTRTGTAFAALNEAGAGTSPAFQGEV